MADIFILGSSDIDGQTLLLVAESDLAIANALDEIKKYVYPFYQEDDDEVLVAQYLAKYGNTYLAAANLWYELPGRMIAGNIKSFDTGAESTEFHSLKEVQEFCNFQGKHFDNKYEEESGTNTGQMIRVNTSTIAGGAIK